MADDSWRNTYDAWKLATPPEYDGPTCSKCGEFLRRDYTYAIPGQSWYCEYCEAEIENE